ncbi:MAG: Uncharacterised protein [Methanobacteriota archaeon]|nr:MAG: Uncharacterised protein [Euryarchaeota archaeon]
MIRGKLIESLQKLVVLQKDTMAHYSSSKFYFYEPEPSDLICPLSNKIIYTVHDDKEHLDIEEKKALSDYLKSQYHEGDGFSTPQKLLISYVIGDEELHNLLKEHIQAYSSKMRRLAANRIQTKIIDYADMILLLAFELNIDLDLIRKRHPKSKHGQQIDQSQLEIKINKLIESTPEDFEQELRVELLKMCKFNNKYSKENKSCVISEQVRKIIDAPGLNFPNFIQWLINNEEKLKIKGFDPLIATIFENKKPRPKFKEIDEDLLENILERVLNISDFNAHLCFEIATYLFSRLEHSTDGTFSNPSINQKQKKFVHKFEKIFAKSEQISNYINLYSHRVFIKYFEDENNNLTFPNWINEKLVNAPTQIVHFDKMCKLYNIKYNYSNLSEKFKLLYFNDILLFNHICKIIQKETKTHSNKGEDFSGSLLYGGEGKINIKKSEMALNGYLFDLPNNIRITVKDDTIKNQIENIPEELMDKSIEIWIKFINNLSENCYIHTTPFTCKHFHKAINKIQKETKAKFLYYDFNKEIDEDYFFFSYTLSNNLKIITEDTFRNYKQKNRKMYNAISPLIRKPKLNDSEEIELCQDKNRNT